MDIQLVVAIIGFSASIVAVSLSYFFTKRHQFKMEERRLKEEHYKAFIKSVSDLAIDKDKDEVQRKYADTINSILMIGNSQVVRVLMDFHNFTKIDSAVKAEEVNTPAWKARYNVELTKIIKVMRKDLFGNNYDDEKVFPTEIHLAGFKPKNKRGY
jgi:hypothetical protein